MTTTAIKFTYTAAGQLALFNAGLTGVELSFTHLQAGSGHRTPDGTERQLVTPQQTVTIAAGGQISTTQIRMAGIFTGDTSFPVSELGLWQGDPSRADSILVAYWSQPTGNLVVKSAGVDFVFSHDMVLAFDIPLGTIKVLVDPSQSVMLAALHRHEQAINPHPQYLTEDEVQSLIEARVGDYVVAGGTANALTAVLVPAVTAYTAQTTFTFKALTTNSGAATMNAGGGAKAIVRNDGSALVAGDIQTGAAYAVVFDPNTSAFVMTEVVPSQLEKQIATAAQLQTKTAILTTGTAPTYAAAPKPAVLAYAPNLRLALTVHDTPSFSSFSKSPSLNVSGLGAKSLMQYDHAGAKVKAVLKKDQRVDVVFDGTDFVVMNPLTPTPVVEVPAGFIGFAESVEDGWLVRDGTLYPTAIYTKLFASIGFKYGGNGIDMFAVPDDRNRTIVGAGLLYANGSVGGSKDAVVVYHAHGTYQSPHQHGTSWGEAYGGNYGYARGGARGYGSARTDSDNYEYLTSPEYASIGIHAEGQSGVDRNMMPYRAYIPVIKY